RIGGSHMVAFRTDDVFAIEAPAPPLRHHTLRQIAHFAKTLTREVADESDRQRHDDEPQPPYDALRRPAVIEPVAGTRRDSDDAVDLVSIRNEAKQLAAQAVTDPVKRQVRMPRFEVVDDCGTV